MDLLKTIDVETLNLKHINLSPIYSVVYLHALIALGSLKNFSVLNIAVIISS
jgi:hypothetical protein